MNESRVKPDFDVLVVRGGRDGVHELAIRNGSIVAYTDEVVVAREKDRRRALSALRRAHDDDDLAAVVEQRLLEAAAADRKARAAKRPQPRSTKGDGADAFARALSCTDVGNAAKFAEMHGQNVRYIPALRGWHTWSGRHWRLDETGEVYRLARKTQRAILTDAARETHTERQAALVKHALATAAKPRMAAMVELAKSEPGIPLRATDVDCDTWLFNVQNGTVDLRTGELREHRRTDHITKIAPVDFDPNARLDAWDRFLHDTTGGDGELGAFLQRAAGYSLAGVTTEERFLFVHGPPAAGKTTFLEALLAVFGDYGDKANADTFTTRKTEGPRDDVARLAGLRLVVTVEVDEGKRLAEGLVKQLTGGDSITARHLYRDLFTFKPQFALWIAANHAPRVSDRDAAIWRRILRVPFANSVPEDRRDPGLKAELTDPRRAGPAVLAWCVAGCLQWQDRGLEIPGTVRQATEQYREEQDPLRRFLDECCILTADAWTSSSRLREAFEEFAQRRLPHDFADRLRDAGCEQQRRREGGAPHYGWRGIGLRSLPEEGGRDA